MDADSMQIDEEESGRIARQLRTAIADYGLVLNPSAVLSRMIFVAEQAGLKGVLATQTPEQVRLLGQAWHVTRCLDWFRGVDDDDQVVGWLRKSLDRINTPTSPGLDRLFEIEIAGRLARHNIFRVRTGEPDVVAESDHGKVVFACKHPDTQSGVARRIVEGADQIERDELPGIVIVSLDSVYNNEGRLLRVTEHREAADWAAARSAELAASCESELRRAFQCPAVVGVIFILVVPFLVEEPVRYVGFHMGGEKRPNPAVEGSANFVDLIVRLLYD